MVVLIKLGTRGFLALFFFKQKSAYEITVLLEFRRVLFRSNIHFIIISFPSWWDSMLSFIWNKRRSGWNQHIMVVSIGRKQIFWSEIAFLWVVILKINKYVYSSLNYSQIIIPNRFLDLSEEYGNLGVRVILFFIFWESQQH